MTVGLREVSATNSSFSCKNGVIPPTGCANTRNTADAVAACVMRLERSDFACSIKAVVAVPPQWTETHSLIRYPSPYGRSCTLRCRPPFFRPLAQDLHHRRGLAQWIAPGGIGFDLASGMTLSRVIIKEKQTRGFNRCTSNPNSYYASRPCLALRPAAIPSASRPLSELARGPVRLPLSAAVSPRAPLSARRATSPIARASRTAANTVSRALTGAADQIETTGAPARAGGFFVVTSARPVARPRNERGDEICSRRS